MALEQERTVCCHSKPWVNNWVQNVHTLGLFLNSSQWYRVTGLQISTFDLLKSLDTKLSSFL